MLLSFPYSNRNKLPKSIDTKIYRVIFNQLSNIKITSKNIKKTHFEFNQKVKNIIIKKKLKNFLRIGFLQKIFFVHNRLFILFELLELKKKQWKFYKPLLKESSIGDPVRYFL